MSPEQLALALYYLCVDFMVNFADVAGITYRDANALILFLFIPSVLLIDVLLYFMVVFSKRNNRNNETTETN